jgi:mRNA interferase YafQ
LKIIVTPQFKKDYEKVKKQGKDISILKSVIKRLFEKQDVSEEYKVYEYEGFTGHCSTLFLKPDWVLVYRINDKELSLLRTCPPSEA